MVGWDQAIGLSGGGFYVRQVNVSSHWATVFAWMRRPFGQVRKKWAERVEPAIPGPYTVLRS